MREESGSDKDAEEPEEWDDDGEASSDEDESDEEAKKKMRSGVCGQSDSGANHGHAPEGATQFISRPM